MIRYSNDDDDDVLPVEATEQKSLTYECTA